MGHKSQISAFRKTPITSNLLERIRHGPNRPTEAWRGKPASVSMPAGAAPTGPMAGSSGIPVMVMPIDAKSAESRFTMRPV
jgi:hypothetical protein